MRYKDYKLIAHEKTIGSESDIAIGQKQLHITTNILGKHNHGYIAVGLTCADIVSHKLTGRDCVQTDADISLDLHLQAGRLTPLAGIYDSVIIDSSYNASPLSMQAAINDVYRIQHDVFPKHKVILVLGDMRELGEREEKHHRELAAYLSQYGDSILLLGAAMNKYTIDELKKIGHNLDKVELFSHYDDLGKKIKSILESDSTNNYIILFKGSQNTIFLEEAIKHILLDQGDEKKLTRQ